MTLSPHWPGPQPRGHELAGSAGGGGGAPATTTPTTGKRVATMSHHAHRPHDARTDLVNSSKSSLGTKLSYEIRLDGKGVVTGSLYDPLLHEAHPNRALLSASAAAGLVGSSATPHARAPTTGTTTTTKRRAHSPARQEHQLPGKRHRIVVVACGRCESRCACRGHHGTLLLPKYETRGNPY
ncbi:BQ2448_7809 [Microbotryum intermedium]|uniref:BQ2448_7809 protein n=1 Tax=Microbotryum intermedium TaxID=269621 RepID=A0A238FLZ7_9BASI|nr:BQ2448_7809 [Microbotryum intermedium]